MKISSIEEQIEKQTPHVQEVTQQYFEWVNISKISASPKNPRKRRTDKWYILYFYFTLSGGLVGKTDSIKAENSRRLDVRFDTENNVIKIEKQLVTILDLKSDSFIRVANHEKLSDAFFYSHPHVVEWFFFVIK